MITVPPPVANIPDPEGKSCTAGVALSRAGGSMASALLALGRHSRILAPVTSDIPLMKNISIPGVHYRVISAPDGVALPKAHPVRTLSASTLIPPGRISRGRVP